MQRRDFLQLAGGALAFAAAGQTIAKPDFTLRLGKADLELEPGKIVKTTGFNGSAPGPMIRVKEGQRVTIEVVNETDKADIVHWHGLHVPSDVDGAMEEGSLMVDPKSSRTYSFIAKPSGTRWYHSHTRAARDLKRATYSGEFGFFYIEPKEEAGAYDQEQFLAFKEWDAYLTTGGEGDDSMSVAYTHCSVNSHALGFGEPIRVKQGQRVMLRMLNASATVTRRIAFAGHKFRVMALDGNPVPTPKDLEILEMGPAERIDALVEMNNPGVWILGATDDHDREQGLGIVIEYANQTGPAQWIAPPASVWDYRIFGGDIPHARSEATTIPLVFQKKWAGNRWVDYWTVNGRSYPKTDIIRLRANETYRLLFDNQSDEAHPLHLHRHTFELVEVEGTATCGIRKDVVVIGAKRKMQVEFKADNPGATLFHCHQQMHMDYGFMTLMEYV
jgi:FtsP/CotA-like multicopper oxidase with cupredoxin domain